MLDTNDLVRAIKKAAVEAVEASSPVGITYGTVVNVNPLKIKVEQKMTLTDIQLVLTRTVKDNALQIGEGVLLISEPGGQKYIVIDRL